MQRAKDVENELASGRLEGTVLKNLRDIRDSQRLATYEMDMATRRRSAPLRCASRFSFSKVLSRLGCEFGP